MNIDQLIKNWHSKASEEDYFSKFVFEYLAFIAYLKKRKFSDSRDDRNAIQRLKRDSETKDLYFQKIESRRGIKDAWNKVMSELNELRLGNVSSGGEEAEEIKWWNCPHDQLHQQTMEEKQQVKGVIRDLNDWENMVEFWYSIRNNLFHGGKNPQDSRDQQLIKYGYKTLRPLVEIFLSGNNTASY